MSLVKIAELYALAAGEGPFSHAISRMVSRSQEISLPECICSSIVVFSQCCKFGMYLAGKNGDFRCKYSHSAIF
jgi:hypothetical protein